MRLLIACVAMLPGPRTHCSADELYDAARDLRSKQIAKLQEVAAWCDARGLDERARQTRRFIGPSDPYHLYLPVLPRKTGGPELPPTPTGDVQRAADAAKWDARFADLRRGQATELYDMARKAIRTGRASLAYDLALAAVRANPDHGPVRRLLGYQEYQGMWRTLYEVRKLRSGNVWHEKFGWLPKNHVSRYERGERFDDGRWITAAEDAQRHAAIRDGWLIETEHYRIRTNHGLELGVALSEKLERLYHVWQRLFVAYYASDAQLRAQFDGGGRGQRFQPRPFQVELFRDRAEYNRALRTLVPNIDVSVGFYYQPTQRAYFFAGEGYEDRTLYHEATHQLFHQSRPVAADVGFRANFWIVEGIAMFMESLREEDGYYVLGGFEDDRLHAARYRLVEDDFYVPLSELTTWGMQQIQNDPRIATLYSQSAGLTHFLIFHDEGRYRDALVAYLRTVYEGRDTPATLEKLTATGYPQLDQQYREFIQESIRRKVGRL